MYQKDNGELTKILVEDLIQGDTFRIYFIIKASSNLQTQRKKEIFALRMLIRS